MGEIAVVSLALVALVVIAVISASLDGKSPSGTKNEGSTEYPKLYSEYVKKAAKDYKIEEARIYAVIMVESSFRADSVSVSDARGLMQMLPSTYEDVCKRRGMEYNPDELFDPAVNIDACTYYLNWLYERLGNWNNVHIAYNAGIGNVLKWLENGDYCENGIIINTPSAQANAYIDRIEYYYNEYKNN